MLVSKVIHDLSEMLGDWRFGLYKVTQPGLRSSAARRVESKLTSPCCVAFVYEIVIGIRIPISTLHSLICCLAATSVCSVLAAWLLFIQDCSLSPQSWFGLKLRARIVWSLR